MLDSGASTSIISLDIARRLKLRVEPRGEQLLNGIDGVKAKVTNKCRVKITLGHRVVYTLDVWVGNIGQGIDALLGMNFMVAAGVRLCAHEREVVLQTKNGFSSWGPQSSHLGRAIDVSIHVSLWLAPGDSKYIPIRASEPDLESMDVWVSRGAERGLDAEVRERKRTAPPKVDRSTYSTPTRVLRRTPEISAAAPEGPDAHRTLWTPEPSGVERPERSVPGPWCEDGPKPGDLPSTAAPGPGTGHVMTVSDVPQEPAPRPRGGDPLVTKLKPNWGGGESASGLATS
ncbi:hypothetical protein PHMEG_00013828 [Phytophthora megakarya]|uniref:Peptidase A2 domain-containing protein n=1 Tax=Phytophthora megakarya TaxID=4795 RepID=A0A225W5A9_9STRA|nr:hypothetical protein PHMEG_00013828 [Phytophthora megakarya]